MRIHSLAAFLAAVPAALALAQPLTTAFTFQGQLTSTGSPASGLYDFQFALFDAASGGSQQGPTLCSDNVAVSGGVFTVTLDFGAQFSGSQRFIEVRARQDSGLSCADATGFTTLSPRQSLTASPNAAFSLSTANALQLGGQPASFYTNAANLTGTLADARLSSNVALLSGAQTFSGAKTFSATLNLAPASGTGIIFAAGTTPLITAGQDNAAGHEKRMWIAHSEALNNWGIQYRDLSSDGFAADSIEVVAGNQTRPQFGFVLGSRLFNGYDPMGATTVSVSALTGAAQFNGGVTQSYSGTLARATPVAFGAIASGGTVSNGTPNVASAVWNPSLSRYEITLIAETYAVGSYTTTITPSAASPVIATTDAFNGELVVHLYDLTGASVQAPFSFITYKR
jgi:hypothetical protein